MAVVSAGAASATVQSEEANRYVLPMVLMVSLYFSIGFITALNDILVPHFKLLFSLKAQDEWLPVALLY
jgi:MFS transporter, FHS family, L-fucose permease